MFLNNGCRTQISTQDAVESGEVPSAALPAPQVQPEVPSPEGVLVDSLEMALVEGMSA